MSEQDATNTTKPPLRWTGVIFALAAKLLLPTAIEIIAEPWICGAMLLALVSIIAPLIAGAVTASYAPTRGHARLPRRAISVPILGFLVFPGQWQFAIFAGAFCTLGGTIMELVMRRGKAR